MSNDRIEKLYVSLSEPIGGFDPMMAIDPQEFAWHTTDMDAGTLGLVPLSEFYPAGFSDWSEDDKWFPAAGGLNTVRRLIAYYLQILDEGVDRLERSMETIQEKIDLLKSVENVLNKADDNEIAFRLLVQG